MTATEPTQNQPPEAELQFDIGSTDDSLERMVELFARHGDVYRVFVPARKAHTYVIHHPDDVKRVLVSNHRNYTKGVGLDRVKILLGKGLMTSEGDLWKRQRYMMQPFFHRRVITEFAQTLDSANDRFLARWEALTSRGEPVNLTDEMSELTLDSVLRSIFGRDLDRMSQQVGGNPFEVVTKEQGRNLQFAFKFRSLAKVVAELLAKRRAQQAEHFDYVAMLMSARDKETDAPMSDRELIDEVMTLIVAGHETTASGLNWTWYLLSQHPEVEARLHAEIDAAPDMTAPSLAQMETLTYTQQVVNEALRLYPPGWLLSRRTIEADVLGGYPIAPGTNVLLPLYLLHRDGRFWKDPDVFWPERFAPEHESERPRFAYMPFAAGPRHCIGETFALYEMLIHLYKVARRYRLIHVPDKPLELEAQINLRTRYPLHMRLERR
ncbi:MAG: cytochrome [Gammaproteobacteria bacterium]|jgi:cytochrome P450|nr:cytochrome [Gammaproteobacteria bacterium]